MTEKDRTAARARSARFRAAHPDQRRAEGQAYRKAHPEMGRAAAKRRRERDPEGVKAANARSRAKRRPQNNEYNKAYYQSHKAEIKARHQSPENRAHNAAYMAKRRADDPEGMLEINRKHYRAHPERSAIRAHNRRARILGVDSGLTAEQWLTIQATQHHRCYYCGKRCKGRLSQDHITPLSKGGTHTLHNVIGACRSCNSKKRAGPPPIPVQPLLL